MRPALVVDGRGIAAGFEVPRAAAGGDLLLVVDWLEPQTHGTYLQCLLQQYDSSGQCISNIKRIVGGDARYPQPTSPDCDMIRSSFKTCVGCLGLSEVSPQNAVFWGFASLNPSHPNRQTGFETASSTSLHPSIALFPIEATTTRVTLSLENAYHNHSIAIGDCQVYCLDSSSTATGHRPRGYVGLTTTCAQQVPELLRDMVDNYEHYRTAAQTFAKTWFEQHAPAQTIRKISQQSERWLEEEVRRAG